MLEGGDQREPLWATSLADQPRVPDDFFPPERERIEAAPPRRRPIPAVVVAALGALAAIVLVALVTAAADRASVAVDDVPSFWGDVPMTCHTLRFTEGRRAVEAFRCHAVGGLPLPPGLYRSPGDRWTSDITGRNARADLIRISPTGELDGWAVY